MVRLRAIISRCCDRVSGGRRRATVVQGGEPLRARSGPWSTYRDDDRVLEAKRLPPFLAADHPPARDRRGGRHAALGLDHDRPQGRAVREGFRRLHGLPARTGALLGHRRPAHRPDRPGRQARRRGDHHADDLGLDGQHDRGRWRDAGLRGHPPRDPADRREPARGRRHPQDRGHHSRSTSRAPRPTWTRFSAVARRHGLWVFEDAAHGVGSRYKGTPRRVSRPPRRLLLPPDQEHDDRRGRRARHPRRRAGADVAGAALPRPREAGLEPLRGGGLAAGRDRPAGVQVQLHGHAGGSRHPPARLRGRVQRPAPRAVEPVRPAPRRGARDRAARRPRLRPLPHPPPLRRQGAGERAPDPRPVHRRAEGAQRRNRHPLPGRAHAALLRGKVPALGGRAPGRRVGLRAALLDSRSSR